MSTSEVFSSSDVVRGFHTEATTDGPQKIPIVTKSISLQEIGSRPSPTTVLECDTIGEGGHSSGVFSCSVDISDVCMADLTKLSDSVVCSSSESIDKSTALMNNGSAVMSTPLGVSKLCRPGLTSPDVLTPIRSQSDFLSPQFGANDDYLRRNIKFIHKQLGSLMTQLRTEDKYFRTCSQRYEEIIANLENEISVLRSHSNNSVETFEAPNLTNVEKSHQLESELAQKSKIDSSLNEHGAKDILEKIIRDLLPRLRSIVLSASETFPVCTDKPGIPDLHIKEGSYENVSSVFDRCLTQLDKLIKGMSTGAAFSPSPGKELLSNSRTEVTSMKETNTEWPHETQTRTDVMNPSINGKSGNDHESSMSGRSHSEQIILNSEESLRLDEENCQIKSELNKVIRDLAKTNDNFLSTQAALDNRSTEYERLLQKSNFEKAVLERHAEDTTIELSKTKQELTEVVEENDKLKTASSAIKVELADVGRKLKDKEIEYKTVIEEFRIKGSNLILENSKLKEELRKLQAAFEEAQVSSEKSADKFRELQTMYESLIGQMRSKEAEFSDLGTQKADLEELLISKDAVLSRLCSNFNELLAIFRECQDLGLGQDSSTTDVDDGFIKLKRRLLDLSQDYITLNNRNKVLEQEAMGMSTALKEKQLELINARKKHENKFEKLQRTLEIMEDEKRLLVSQKIDQEDMLKKLRTRVKELELQETKGCRECSCLRNQLQQLQIDLVDKDATIATLELHIQSCCEHNRKKAQQYKHELHSYKRQVDAHSSYAVDFSLSPKLSKSLNPKVDVGVQYGDTFLHHHTGGFVERFKIGELEEKVIKLEKERTVLKRLCKIRSDRIRELETLASLSNSNASK